MYKDYARSIGVFDNYKTYHIDEWEDRNKKLTLYAKYDNYIEIDETIRSKWWERYLITWFDELVQVNLWLEYEVQAEYVRPEDDEWKELITKSQL